MYFPTHISETSVVFLFPGKMKLRIISSSLFILSVILSPVNTTNGLGVTVLDGHVYVEGVMSLYPFADGQCGGPIDTEAIQNMESVRWTFMELNKNKESNLYGQQIGKYFYNFGALANRHQIQHTTFLPVPTNLFSCFYQSDNYLANS